ncbi:inositol monophosphatase 1-like [Drosophila albomicans]|uniref:Inositol-1-monophosphatase n=1 Tax=Drosophila albomicans TaxID=7291 RepID=A0A6P8X0P4_DROAB|nr:inositol monophosphatase 1-like [Drosophila albomicans]
MCKFMRAFSRQFSTLDGATVCQLVSRLSPECSKIMLKALNKRMEYTTKKHSRDILTKADKAVERLLVSGIRKEFPEHQIIAEEGTEGVSKSKQLTAAPTWIIDPIDGTMNFLHGFPYFCTSIAFYAEKQAQFGWIHNPLLRQTFVAQRGKGFYFNDQRMQASKQRDLKKSLIFVEWSLKRNEDHVNVAMDNMLKLLPIVHGIRSLGSTALNIAQVAIGACDAYIQFGPQIWDTAAGVLMVREAGGVVLDPCGGEYDLQSQRLLATSTAELAEQLIPMLTQVFPD